MTNGGSISIFTADVFSSHPNSRLRGFDVGFGAGAWSYWSMVTDANLIFAFDYIPWIP